MRITRPFPLSERLFNYLCCLLFFCVLIPLPASAYHGTDQKPAASLGESLISSAEKLGGALADDGAYFFRSVLNDMGDLLKLPFEEKEIGMRDIVTGALVVGSIPATIYGLDDPIRRNVRKMPNGTAGILQDVGLGVTVGSLGVVYGWGLYSGDEAARHAVLTGIESIGVISLVGLGAKAAFGRQRPSDGDGSRAFFKGGDSFPSGKSGLAFAAATTLSEAFDNRWWVAIPSYGLAIMTGVGRMGKDAHWASDVLVSALSGVSTTKLLFYLHRQREWPSSLSIIPMTTDKGVVGASLSFSW